MSTDPLRLDDFIYRLIYEKGYKTWSSLLKKATKDPEIPSASLRVEHLFPQHPYFPIGLELDTTGLLTATSTWVPGTGSCDLPPFEQPFRILPRVATPTRLFTSTKLPLLPSVWFKQSDNHLTVLVLAWATTSVSRRHEFTLAFLTQGIARYRFPPIYPYPPLGSTAVEDLDLDVRLHIACQGGHGLELSNITWTCAGSKNEVQEAVALTTIICPSLKSSHPTAASLIDYRGLGPDKDISEQVTRNVFMWMREIDGFPINEREIHKHEWFNDGDSDGDDSNCAEGDCGSTMGCNLSVKVGGWISGVMTARCNSL
ncbi:hypothetical protein FOC1_g10000216 [Fusarium oxysporum f. sp. cubense race 1]|uniref:Uncharacterized protein n=1 Tax=Fusarium oxysporum f. sp. cubense (strain race 1) TaxID=1229664 RepID=N4U4B4_FUSC1|nr:hypothetical protein FOC1_g10000216 [Fusarium oxysporum f. sp. cubense race 1]